MARRFGRQLADLAHCRPRGTTPNSTSTHTHPWVVHTHSHTRRERHNRRAFKKIACYVPKNAAATTMKLAKRATHTHTHAHLYRAVRVCERCVKATH